MKTSCFTSVNEADKQLNLFFKASSRQKHCILSFELKMLTLQQTSRNSAFRGWEDER